MLDAADTAEVLEVERDKAIQDQYAVPITEPEKRTLCFYSHFYQISSQYVKNVLIFVTFL